jgi:predicted small integral membrane protein
LFVLCIAGEQSTGEKEAQMTARYAKIAMVLSLGVMALLIAFTNVTDYGGNYPFVSHVMSMDSTFRSPAVKYRAITDPRLWALAYWLIIAGEAAAAGLFLWAGARMVAAREASAAAFQEAKGLVHLAAAAGFLVWFLGFMVIGGEWFLMWQSKQWNGQQPAFRFYMTILAVLIYVTQPDAEPARPERSR